LGMLLTFPFFLVTAWTSAWRSLNCKTGECFVLFCLSFFNLGKSLMLLPFFRNELDFKIVFFIFVYLSVVVSFGSPLFFLTLGKIRWLRLGYNYPWSSIFSLIIHDGFVMDMITHDASNPLYDSFIWNFLSLILPFIFNSFICTLLLLHFILCEAN
jgi:hypothetical protein